jgi:drug/metabolite transporter (DMT)-like permease
LASGATMGICYFIAYFFVIYTVKWVGASSSTVVGVLSILLPIACGIFLWSEQPNSMQAIGIVLALCSLFLIGGQRVMGLPKEKNWLAPLVLIVFFLLAGFSRLSQAAFKHISTPDQMPTFLLAAFTIAAIPSLVLLLWRGRWPTKMELLFGALLGSANILQSHFILESLERFEGFIVFPVVSAGGLMLTTLVATQMLGEKLNFRTYAGIGLACCALVLLHWLPGSSS